MLGDNSKKSEMRVFSNCAWASPWALALGGLSFAAVALVLACTGGDNPSNATELSAPVAEGYLLGVTSNPRFATTAPPPPPPEPGPDDDLVRIHGILLAFDHDCPDCTLTTRRGRAFVPHDARLFGSGPEEEFPITFAELNQALRPGLPMRIHGVPGAGANDPAVAEEVRVEHYFATTGDIDVSSSDVLLSRKFRLAVFTAETGRVEIDYLLADNAVVEPFSALERVYVSGVVSGGDLVANLVRRDE